MREDCSSLSAAAPSEAYVPRLEWMALAAAGVALLVLRAVALFHQAVDSDETQHLHVAWAWSEGFVQYRDVFDNHAPLLHLLSAPLVALVGERADVVLWVRMAMVPLFLVTLLAAFFIARRLYSPRVACWAVAIVAFYPPFFLKSLEYRADNLWAALSMLAVALLVSRRNAASGFVLGCAVCASIKTLPLVLAVILCALCCHPPSAIRHLPLRRAVAAVAAFLAMPAAIAVLFALRGAWSAMLYCVFEFNLLVTRPERNAPLAALLCALAILLASVLLARLWNRTDEVRRDRLRVAYLVTVFALITQAFWPILSQRDYLAVMPLLAMFLVGEAIDRPLREFSAPVLAALVLLFGASLFRYTSGFRDHTARHIAAMRQVLELTRPGEWVMDHKGETVFRHRPFYYALETVARTAIAGRKIADTIPEDIVARRCHVAGPLDDYYPPRARAFLRKYFLDVGALRASGQWVRRDGAFAIAVPGRYVIATERGLARGMLDGTPLTGPVTLRAGTHRFVRTAAGERVACFWADAYERGYSPFRLP